MSNGRIECISKVLGCFFFGTRVLKIRRELEQAVLQDLFI